VASLAGVSAQTISNYEANTASEPEFFNGLRLAKALGVTPWFLAGESEPTTPQALASETAPPSDPRIPEILAKVDELAEGLARLAAQSTAGSKASRRRRPKSA